MALEGQECGKWDAIDFPYEWDLGSRATRIFATRVERLHAALVYFRKYVFQDN